MKRTSFGFRDHLTNELHQVPIRDECPGFLKHLIGDLPCENRLHEGRRQGHKVCTNLNCNPSVDPALTCLGEGLCRKTDN